jgi:hypothetical protein
VRRRFPVAQPVAAQPNQPSVELVVQAGRPLRVALDERIQLKQVRQAVTGTVTQPVYAYDRIVIAAGTKVRGRVTQIGGGSKFVRARAISTATSPQGSPTTPRVSMRSAPRRWRSPGRSGISTRSPRPCGKTDLGFVDVADYSAP